VVGGSSGCGLEANVISLMSETITDDISVASTYKVEGLRMIDNSDVLGRIADALLHSGEVNIEHVYRYGDMIIVCYVMLDTGVKRVGIYDSQLEEMADFVASE
jgi:hypothetical protein